MNRGAIIDPTSCYRCLPSARMIIERLLLNPRRADATVGERSN